MLRILFLIIFIFFSFIKTIFAMDEKDIHLLISKKYNIEINLNDHKFQYFLGSSYIQGSEIPKDILKGMKLLKLSSDQGNDYAQNALGLIYELGNEDNKNKQE